MLQAWQFEKGGGGGGGGGRGSGPCAGHRYINVHFTWRLVEELPVHKLQPPVIITLDARN